MHITMVRIGKQLDNLGMSWADFARSMGTDNQNVNNWKKRGISKSKLAEAARITQTTTDFIITGKNGVLDETPHSDVNPTPKPFLYQVNTKVLQKVIFELEIAMLESGISLTPGDKAELIAEFYREAIEQEWTTTSQWQEKVAHFLQAV